MKHLSLFFIVVTGLWSASPAMAGTWVNLGVSKGYLSLPRSQEPAATLLLVHDDSGVDPFVIQEADRWAEKGLVTLAVDLYQGAVGKDLKEASRLKDHLDSDTAKKILDAAMKSIKQNPRVDKTRMGVLAWGMGADQVLMWAHGGPELRVLMLFDVQPSLDLRRLKEIQSRILAVYADQDASHPAELIANFEKVLKEAQGSYEIKKFSATHSRYWDYTKTGVYLAKPAQKAREFSEEYVEKFLTLKDHRK